MPYCSQCGNQVADSDRFCARCGSAQAAAGPPPGTPKSTINNPFNTMDARTAEVLCYIPVVGWIASIVVLASDRFQREVNTRFHAFQGLYLFVAWLIVDKVIQPMFWFKGAAQIGRLLEFALFGISIFMIVKTSQRERVELPLIGELANQSLSER